MKQPNPGPCFYNRRPPHAHNFLRGVCHRCGARDESTVDETPWRELEAARLEFRKAAEAFDTALGLYAMDPVKNLIPMVNFRNRIDALRVAEKAFNEG